MTKKCGHNTLEAVVVSIRYFHSLQLRRKRQQGETGALP